MAHWEQVSTDLSEGSTHGHSRLQGLQGTGRQEKSLGCGEGGEVVKGRDGFQDTDNTQPLLFGVLKL